MATQSNTILPDKKEKEMLQCLLSGDQRHFTKLYDAYSGALFSIVTRWIKDPGMAENLLQDVFVKAWRSRNQYDATKGRVFTWLYNVTRSTCIDHLRSKAHKKNKASVLSDNLPLLLPDAHAGGFFSDGIGLRKLVDSLRKEEKEVIELMYFKGYTQQQIAHIMNTPLGTVKTRMTRAIKNLRYYFKKDWQQSTAHISFNL
jgi:RNA polymerase sigma factor (sigma-70 family)